MAQRFNGNLKWMLALLGLAMTLAGAIASYQIINDDIKEMKPKVADHEKYIDADKVDTEYIKRDIAEIRRTQSVILEEVRALK